MGLTSAVLLLASSACGTEARDVHLRDYNLLLITIDTLRADRLGSYGYARAETPHLDALAREGVRFESCYAAVPLTLPSHSTMFTGRYPWATGVRLNGLHFLDESEATLAEVLGNHGFHTSAIVAAYVLTSKFGLAQGFEVYDDSLRMDDLFRFYSEIPADEVYGRFAAWYAARPQGRFFSWVHFYDPHLPYEPPASYLERFEAEPYSGEIAFVDTWVGKILDLLEASGSLERTLVVVTSDHGEAFLEHGEEGHGLLCYEETIRVPLIFYAPAQLAGGRVIGTRVHLVDLMPTLLELLGVEPPTGLQGRSFAALLDGERREAGRRIYFESLAGYEAKNWAPLTGIIADDHKYIAVPEAELYDLVADPHETTNLLRERPELARRLDRELQSLVGSADPQEGESRRQLSAEDRRHLRALGYLGSSTRRSSQMLDPKRGIDIEMDLRRARAYLERGDTDRAERMLAAVVTENPDVELADLYQLRHEIAAAKKDEKAALAALEEGIARFPDTQALRFNLATYLFTLQRYPEVEVLCRGLLDENPRLSEALSLLGRVAEHQQDWSGALSLYEKALKIEPRSIPLQVKIADVLARAGEGEEALAIYDRLIDTGALDHDSEHLYKAAALSSLLGRLDRAEELFRRGLELQPAGVHHLSLALVLARMGKIGEAIGNLEIALQQYGHELTPQQHELATKTLQQWRAAL